MMNFKKIIIKCFLIISLVGILISCGSDTDIVTPDLNSSEENSNQEKNIAPKLLTEKQSDDSGNKDRGGVLKRLWADPATLDPHLVTDTTSAGLVVELFSGLVSLNSDLEIFTLSDYNLNNLINELTKIYQYFGYNNIQIEAEIESIHTSSANLYLNFKEGKIEKTFLTSANTNSFIKIMI